MNRVIQRGNPYGEEKRGTAAANGYAYYGDGSVRTSVKGYLKSFDQLPETAQRLISQLMLGPIKHDLPKK